MFPGRDKIRNKKMFTNMLEEKGELSFVKTISVN